VVSVLVRQQWAQVAGRQGIKISTDRSGGDKGAFPKNLRILLFRSWRYKNREAGRCGARYRKP